MQVNERLCSLITSHSSQLWLFRLRAAPLDTTSKTGFHRGVKCSPIENKADMAQLVYHVEGRIGALQGPHAALGPYILHPCTKGYLEPRTLFFFQISLSLSRQYEPTVID